MSWDPANRSVNASLFHEQNQAVAQKAMQYKSDPDKFNRLRRFAFLAAIPCLVGPIYFLGIDGIAWGIGLMIVPFIGLGIFTANRQRIELDTALFTICERERWIYSPHHQQDDFKMLRDLFQKIFGRGSSQNLENQVWGEIDDHPFWFAFFQYSVKQGKHSRTYSRHVVATKLDRSIPYYIAIEREYFSSKLWNMFTQSDVETQSDEFNKTFTVSYKDEKIMVEQYLAQRLNPPVVEQFLRLKNKEMTEMIIEQDTIMISIDSDQNPLYKKTEHGESDLKKNIGEIVRILQEIGQGLA